MKVTIKNNSNNTIITGDADVLSVNENSDPKMSVYKIKLGSDFKGKLRDSIIERPHEILGFEINGFMIPFQFWN